MRKLILLCVLLVVGYTVSAQFPTTDSLRNYNTRYTTNSAINWFTNQRGNTLLRGIIDWIDSAKLGTSGAVGLDTLYTINDSTLRYKKNGVWTNVLIRGTGGSGAIDSIYVKNAGNSGVEIFYISTDSLKMKRLLQQEGAVITRETDSSISFKTKVTQLSSYTNMRALSTSVLDADYTYIVRASGVNGNFRYDATDTWSADDSAMVIVTSSGKRFKRVTDGYLNAAWFGAIPDDGVDDSWAFQKMFNYIDTSTVLRDYKIFIPGGKYQVATSVTLPQTIYNPGSGSIPRVNIEGDGAVIFVTGAITAWKRLVADITAANNVIGSYFLSISGIEFTGDATTGQKGLELHAIYGANISNMRFTSLDTGLVARFALGSQFENIFYTNCNSVGLFGASLSGIATGCTTSNSAFNANTIYKNRVYCANGSYAGMMISAADGCMFRDNIIEGSKPRYSFYFDSEASSVVNGNHIKTMWFEANGGTYTNNVSMKLRVNGIFTIDGIQNDSPDTLIDWSSSAAGADISLDNVEYWNFSGGKWFKGTPASGMVFRVGRIYGTLTENLFDPAKYNDGIPADVFTLYGYQTASGGYGITATSQLSLKPNLNAATGSKLISIFGNPKPSTDNTFDLGAGSLRWATTYSSKFLSGLTSEDGTGSGFQSSTGVSVGDGYRVTNPDGSARIAFSSGGLQMQYLSGTYATLKLDPSLTYTHGGVTKFGVSNAGEVWINPSGIADLGAFTLQNTGGLYQQGSFRLGGIRAATSNDVNLLVKGESDSTVAQLNFPIVQTSYTPTKVDVTNVASASVTTSYYERTGNKIEVWGEVTIDPTATGDTQITLSLPIASSMSNSYDLSGSAAAYDVNQSARIYYGGGVAIVRLNATDASSHVYSYRYVYYYFAP